VTTDSQIQIIEQVTGETNVHYVTGLTVTHNLDTGDCLCTYQTQWMGGLTTQNASWAVGGTITNTTYDEFGNVQSSNTFPISEAMNTALSTWSTLNSLALPTLPAADAT
jgi:hypothetical protein